MLTGTTERLTMMNRAPEDKKMSLIAAVFLPHGRAADHHTDQTRCYDGSGIEIPCADSGQDAEFKTDHQIPAVRFQVMTDVVVDSLTGLTWCRNANLAEFPLDWQAAHDFINELNGVRRATGRSDWRLPSRRELFTLVSHEVFNPALPKGHPFEDVFPGYYWTCTPCHRLPDQAWYIHLGGGRIGLGMKHGSYMVWPVTSPGGESPPLEDPWCWDVDRQGILDRRTGLTWGHPADAARRSARWQEALDGVKAMNRKATGRHTNWRLPNIRELESLVDIHSHSPAMPSIHPFPVIADGYWSSTTSVYEPSYAWVLYTVDGAVGVGYKAKPDFCAWAVRSS